MMSESPSARFAANFVDVLRAMRTNLTTGIFNAGPLLENVLGNLPAYYSARPLPASPNFGILDLKGAGRGKPAIIVSAGPSLARNVHFLHAAGLRERFVVIAAQTVLKPLLAKGIRPHFVCALDYHEISKRFYEGLTFEDVAGIDLVCQAEANPAIAAAWPGALRMPAEDMADRFIGEAMHTKLGAIPKGATVAHMGHHLARYMGCDPVIYVGQDLAFTDGAYYGAGASIHDQWQSELNEFRTLEMMEHERIMRGKGANKKIPAAGGGEVYSDALLITYLTFFRQMWESDIKAGLRVIDATEGGADKSPATPMRLEDAMREFGPSPNVEDRPLRLRRMGDAIRSRRVLDNAGKAC